MKVLMVCLGNICRSPMAEGILREKALQRGLSIEVDSCGTAAYHIGEHPDPRSIEKSKEYNIDISGLYARQFSIEDFDNFDHILTMDQSNHTNIQNLARSQKDLDKVSLILDYSNPGSTNDVPDPYYGGDQGFEKVYRLLDKANEAFINKYYDEH